eukprot:TRINITY_DN4253_c0_g1_i1.p1 TRINITY_DN4253_c0_g1~~TRINITY_DN4253_c0_g1_i1.p1  ORF type:complete len:210 (-),score=44.20 TRINITY_DN4253_c0_g1_i1:270-899(-)
MYQALLLIEVYVNRVIQYLLMLSYNASKKNADKPVAQFFDSDFNVITEMAQEYLRLSLMKSKENKVVTNENKNNSKELSEKYKGIIAENEALKRKCKELADKVEALSKENASLVSIQSAIQKELSTSKAKAVSASGAEEQKVLEDLERKEEKSKLERRIEELGAQLLTEKAAHDETSRTLKQTEVDLHSFQEMVNTFKATKRAYTCPTL